MTRQVSPLRPQPVSGLMASASVYITVSRSGEMWSPWRSVSSPTLTTAAEIVGRNDLDHAAQQAGGTDTPGQGGDHRTGPSHAVVMRAHYRPPFAPPAVATLVRSGQLHGLCHAPCVPPERRRSLDRNPLSVAFDATPLLGRPTGVGAFCIGALDGLAGSRTMDVSAYAVSWRRRHVIDSLVPPGVSVRPTCDAGTATARDVGTVRLPPVDWFIGRHDVVHGTNFVVPPTSHTSRVVTVHDLTVILYPQLCDVSSLAYPGADPAGHRRGGVGSTPLHNSWLTR